LDTALSCGCTSFSLEQVAAKSVIELLERYRRKHLDRLAYAVVDFSKLGVPQSRRRVIAGTPRIVQALMRECDSSKVRSVADVVAVPRGVFVRDASYAIERRKRRVFTAGDCEFVRTKATWTDHCRPLTQPGFTVMASRGLSWVTPTSDGEAVAHTPFTVAEYAMLQTFPSDYKWPKQHVVARRLVGNAVPPLVARRIVHFARERCGEQVVCA
jgi:site-specific DNA-cytosine methylase